MQKHSKTGNVPFPRPCGATGNDAQKLHALTFAHFRGAVLMHEVLSVFGEMSERFKEPVLKTGDGATHRGFESHSLRQQKSAPIRGRFFVNEEAGFERATQA